MTIRLLLSLALTSVLGASAIAQGTGQRITIERTAPSFPRQEGQVRVQMSIQLFMPSPTDDSEEADKQRDRARQVLYQVAGRECDLLREAIARDCRLESININLNRQSGQQMQGYSINGSMGFQISLK
jgi:hypothetical protein